MAVTLGAPPTPNRCQASSRRLGVIVSGASTGVRPQLVQFLLQSALEVCRQDHETLVVLETGRSGADRAAHEWVRRHHGEVEHVQIAPDWRRYGRAAEGIANQMLLDVMSPVCVLVFTTSLRSCYRARDLLARADAASVPYLITDGWPPISTLPAAIVRFVPDPLPAPNDVRQGELFSGFGAPSVAWLRRMDRAACSLFRDG